MVVWAGPRCRAGVNKEFLFSPENGDAFKTGRGARAAAALSMSRSRHGDVQTEVRGVDVTIEKRYNTHNGNKKHKASSKEHFFTTYYHTNTIYRHT